MKKALWARLSRAPRGETPEDVARAHDVVNVLRGTTNPLNEMPEEPFDKE